MANFLETIQQIYCGRLAEELDEKLTEVVKASELTHKMGSITVEIKMKPKGNSGQMEITPVVKTKVPEHERGTAIMFTTPDFNLIQNDPRQAELDLKKLPPEEKTKNLKKAGNI